MATATETPPGSQLLPSISVEALLAARDIVVDRYERCAALLDEAAEGVERFEVKIPGVEVVFSGSQYRQINKPQHAEAIRQEIDRHFWLRLFQATQSDTLMDSASRRKLWDRLHESGLSRHAEKLPPLTAENIAATFESLHERRGDIFADCVEAVYRGLSWDHKTNSPNAFGHRLIVTGAFYTWPRAHQSDSVYLDRHECLHDLERVLCILSKIPPPAHGVGLRSLGRFPWGEWQTVPSPTGPDGTPLLRVKCYRKGTTHVEILDRSLVDSMNRVMAKRYPHALPVPGKNPKRCSPWPTVPPPTSSSSKRSTPEPPG